MGSTPNLQRLPNLTGDYAKDFPVLQAFFARFMSDVTNTLQGNLKGAANLGWEFHTIKITAPGPANTPVPTSLKSVSWVDVAKAVDATTAQVFSVATGKPPWNYDGNSTVNIGAFNGLTGGRIYNITLVFIP